MDRRSLLCAIAAAIATFGCATAQQSPPSPVPSPGGGTGKAFLQKSCSHSACDVGIEVVIGTDGQPKLKIEDDGNLKMKNGSRDVVIVWKLMNSPQYELHATSIMPHTGAPTATLGTTTQTQWDAQFTFKFNSAVNFVVENKNTATNSGHAFYYDIAVYPKDGGSPVTRDPAIMNDP